MPKSKDWKAKKFKVLGAIKPNGINRIAKIGKGHVTEENQWTYSMMLYAMFLINCVLYTVQYILNYCKVRIDSTRPEIKQLMKPLARLIMF